jgi:hypothetical protein
MSKRRKPHPVMLGNNDKSEGYCAIRTHMMLAVETKDYFAVVK